MGVTRQWAAPSTFFPNAIQFFFQEMKVFWAYLTEVKILQFSNLITLRQGHKNLYQLSTRSPTTAWPASCTLSRKFQTRTLHRRPNIPAWQALRKRCLARYIDNSLTSLSTSKFTCAVDVLQCTRRLVKKHGRKKYPPSDTTIKRRCRPAQSNSPPRISLAISVRCTIVRPLALSQDLASRWMTWGLIPSALTSW